MEWEMAKGKGFEDLGEFLILFTNKSFVFDTPLIPRIFSH